MMTDAQVHKVRFEPLGVEMEVEEGETVLDAAFRQGISLMHGCKEGQCGSCKSRLIEGDFELLKYSTFALPDYESENNHVLLCRTHAFSDLTVGKGRYGTRFRREERPGPMILVGGGSGMSPLWSILTDHIASGEQRPVRFFYGARTRSDLFLLEELASIAGKLTDFKFIPAL